MALTPRIDVSEGRVLVSEEPNGDIQLSQGRVRAAINFPSVAVSLSEGSIETVITTEAGMDISEGVVLAAVRGRTANPQVRAWTFSLDGHDFYVLRIGDDDTLVYDMYSEQWMEWTSPDSNRWRPTTGINWIGGTPKEPFYGSNIAVGDDTYGLVWILDPNQGYDQSPNPLAEEPNLYFERIVMGQLPMIGRTVLPCYVAHLSGDQGDPAYSGAGVTLSTSDDGGQSFNDYGEIAITSGEYSVPQTSWYSLGQIKAPGRLFKIVDDGALARIDSLDVNDGG